MPSPHELLRLFESPGVPLAELEGVTAADLREALLLAGDLVPLEAYERTAHVVAELDVEEVDLEFGRGTALRDAPEIDLDDAPLVGVDMFPAEEYDLDDHDDDQGWDWPDAHLPEAPLDADDDPFEE